jgi:hypothetical protein
VNNVIDWDYVAADFVALMKQIYAKGYNAGRADEAAQHPTNNGNENV